MLFDSDFAGRERSRRPRRARWGLAFLTGAAASALIFAIAPSPYVIETPGPVYDTLGTVTIDGEEQELIQISGQESFETTGSLDLLTVSIIGNPESRVSWLEAGLAWFDRNKAVVPMEAVFPADVSGEEREAQNQALMVDSQQDAIAAALINQGYPVGRTVYVAGLAEDSAAEGLIEPDDLILRANGVAVVSVAELREQVQAGAGAPVALELERAGSPLSVSVTPTQAPDGSWVLGIIAGVSYEFPFEVNIQLESVGGPSAGLTFALGIIDKLDKPSLTDGKIWSGTGTIDADGNVGGIGGVRQKMAGAKSAGAEFMLAPKSNCDEVVGNVPDGLDVFAVATLDQALTVMETLGRGADSSQLPRCTAG